LREKRYVAKSKETVALPCRDRANDDSFQVKRKMIWSDKLYIYVIVHRNIFLFFK